MGNNKMSYEVFLDHFSVPPMYGIRYDTVSVEQLSTNFDLVDCVARLCNEGELAAVHLKDIAKDFFGV